jgi:hypothetical protein
MRAGLGPRNASGSWASARQASTAALTGLAPLGVVFELFVEEKELFAGSKDELITAVLACK